MNSNQKKGKAKPSQTTTVKVTTSQPKSKVPATRPNRKRKRNSSGLAADYIKTLNNPFEHTACQIGFGTMVGTKCGTAVFRSVLTANTEGSLNVVAFPGSDVLGFYSTKAGNLAKVYGDWSPFIDASSAEAKKQFSSIRPISCGMRITPDASNNDKGTRAVLGLVPYSQQNGLSGVDDYRLALTSLSTQAWYGSHLLNHFTIGSGGHESFETLWRPQDLENYIFTRDLLQFNTAGDTVVFPLSGPAMIMAIYGPPSLKYDIEIVCRYEGLPNMGGLFAGDPRKATGYYSLEHLWDNVSPYLNADSAKVAATSVKMVWDAWSTTRRGPNLKMLGFERDDFVDVRRADDEKLVT